MWNNLHCEHALGPASSGDQTHLFILFEQQSVYDKHL
jgi:hypothetical protein